MLLQQNYKMDLQKRHIGAFRHADVMRDGIGFVLMSAEGHSDNCVA